MLNRWAPLAQQLGPSCSTAGFLLLNIWAPLVNSWAPLAQQLGPSCQQLGPSCSTAGFLLINRWAPLAQQVGGPFLLNGWPSCDTCGSSSSSCSPSFPCGHSCCPFGPFCYICGPTALNVGHPAVQYMRPSCCKCGASSAVHLAPPLLNRRAPPA